MQYTGDLRDFDNYFGLLIQKFNPKQPSYTQGCTILTSFHTTNIGINIDAAELPNQKTNETNPKYLTFPKICLRSAQLSTTIINTQKYLFISGNNQCAYASTVNLLYLLTVYSKVRILLTIKTSDIFDQNKTVILQILTNLNKILQKVNSVQNNFGDCFGFSVDDARQFQMQKYINQLRSVLNKPTFAKLSQKVKSLFENIINKKKIVLHGPSRLLKNCIKQIKVIPQFQANPKSLTKLYQQILIPDQLLYLQRQYKKFYQQPRKITINLLKQAFENKEIFDQVQQKRQQALRTQIYDNLPFVFQTPQHQQKKMKKLNLYAVQSVYSIFVNLTNYQQDFFAKNNAQGFVDYNCKDQYNQWNQNVLNLSVIGKVLQIIFCQLTIYYHRDLMKTARYLHFLFRFFENLPDTPIRKQELQLMKDIHQIIKNIIQFFFESLGNFIEILLKEDHQVASPLKLLRLTYDIKRLIDLLLKINTIKRKPYKELASYVQQNYVVLVSSFVFSAWKCYQVYIDYWTTNQKNCFMLELYEICRKNQYKSYFKTCKIKKICTIYKKINEYLGDYSSKKKQYFIASKFYTAGKLAWKQVETINLWLKKFLEQNNYNMNDIEEGILKLSRLGLIEQARKWCYKFMDRIDQNTQFIVLLQQMTNFQINQNKMVLQEIVKFKFNQLQTTQDKVFDAVKGQLSQTMEEWLIFKI